MRSTAGWDTASKYYRLDLDGPQGEHIGLFAEVSPKGVILQQFGVGMDSSEEADLERCRLTTVADVTGIPLTAIDPALGWRLISPEDYEEATELKRRIFLRDAAVQVAARPPCAACGGTGRYASTGKTCTSCHGTGRL